MRGAKFTKVVAIIAIPLFLGAFSPSALSPAEGVNLEGTARTVTSAVVSTADRATFAGIGVGTIAGGSAIAEAAVIAVATSQSNPSISTTVE